MKRKPDGLVLRGNVWWLVASIDGKRIRRSLGIPKEMKKAAQRAVSEFWLEVARGKLGISKPDPTLEQLFDNYIQYKTNEVTPYRIECISNYLDRALGQLGNMPLSHFNVKSFINWLIGMKTRRTAKEIRVLVDAVFNHAVRLGEAESNPLKNAPRIKHDKKTKTPLSLDEFIQFGELADGYSCGRLLLFLMKTGCRFSEAALATWNRVNLDAGTFTLRPEDTKTRISNTVGLSQDLCIMLSRMKTDACKPLDSVFLNQSGSTFSKDRVRRTVKSIGKQINRSDITTHTLRHTYTTLCRDLEDVKLDEVQKALGHTSSRMTRLYDHPNPARQRKIADKLPVFRSLFA